MTATRNKDTSTVVCKHIPCACPSSSSGFAMRNFLMAIQNYCSVGGGGGCLQKNKAAKGGVTSPYSDGNDIAVVFVPSQTCA